MSVLEIINCSSDTGIFPDALQIAVVRPLLKKHNLHPSILCNFRPIPNLPFSSKILEKVVFTQIDAFVNENNICEKFPSGFRSGHSTETALLKMVNYLRVNADGNKVLVLLDLSVAFDTVDHDILMTMNCLNNCVGLSGTVLNWFNTYLKGIKYFVNQADHHSNEHEILYSAP